ncbi:zinc metalloproteinase nas-13-like [Pocillopora verrucosa]|uniref:zinc metalloproteinase nas-13-like n=1 Tax=Pocillopora verrucosa TaxID=203993 RepID=UPI003340277E
MVVFVTILQTRVGDAVARWLLRWTLGREVQGRDLVRSMSCVLYGHVNCDEMFDILESNISHLHPGVLMDTSKLFLGVLTKCRRDHVFLLSYNSNTWYIEISQETKRYAKESLLEDNRALSKRGAVRSSLYKWSTSTEDGKTVVKIPYVVQDDLHSKAKTELQRAIQDVHEATCVKFQARIRETDYVSFQPASGCFSKIGKRPGKQDVILGTGCEYKGTILHEIVHLLGFYHEHNRKDRDSYLKIYEDNLDPAVKDEVMKKTDMDNLGFAYDFKSIMQYSKTTFAKSSGLVTMEARSDPNMELGNENAMSAADIMKINKFYNCPQKNDVYKNMEVMVQTGDGYWDGSDAFLYLELIGDKGSSGESSVAKGGLYDDFEGNAKDNYLVAFKDVGTIRKLKIRLQENPDGSYFDGWTVAKITVKDGDKTYIFGERDVDPGETVTVNAS